MELKTQLFKKLDNGNYVDYGRQFEFAPGALEDALKKYMEKDDTKLGVLADRNSLCDPTVKLMDVSHKVTDVTFEEDGINVNIDTLCTPRGKVLESFIMQHINPKFTINMAGNLDEETNTITEIYEVMSINVTDLDI